MTTESPAPSAPSDCAHGRAVIVGRIEVVEEDGENFKHDLALVVVFNTPEECRKAIADGRCTFKFGGEG